MDGKNPVKSHAGHSNGSIGSRIQIQSPQSPEAQPRTGMDRNSGVNLRAALRSPTSNGSVNGSGTIRAVTPDMTETHDSPGGASLEAHYLPRSLSSHNTSPRSIPGGAQRRQGMVFNDAFDESYESNGSSPPPQGHRLVSGAFRPRTRTVTDAMLTGQRAIAPAIANEHRNRVGSVSSSGSQAVEEQRLPGSGMESMGFPTIMATRLEVSTHPSVREKKSAQGRRLIKRQSSRPTSPSIALPPSVDSLPFPITTDDPKKILMLMKTLCGRMRGEVEYQGETRGPWHAGTAYIDDDKGCLMFDSGQSGPFHIPLVADLRGCRILPVDYPEAGKRCLELVSSSPIIEILLFPLVSEELDLWLAALLSWQQLRPSAVKLSNAKPSSPVSPIRPELKKRGYSADSHKTTNIIKVGKVQVWDKGPAANTKSIMRRASTRDPRSPTMAWRRVSCILQDNGEFKLMNENDITILAVIDMSQLSRYAIQQLDRTVLDEEYCLVIFPMYAAMSTQLSIFRPVYLALDNRVHLEVWFALLRAFAVPDVYHLDDPDKEQVEEVHDVEKDHNGEVFRLEKAIMVRVTEAKMKAKSSSSDVPIPEKGAKIPDVDPLAGNYLAEVIMQGEVRSRTTTKLATKNPFWREDCRFSDLPPIIPHLSVVLKRVEGIADIAGLTSSSSTTLTKPMTPLEIVCGTVEIPLASSEPGQRDQESWLAILNEKQETIGSMLVKVSYEEHVVLLAKEYQPLSELLHNLTSGLTAVIATAMPVHLRRLAELFLNIFQVSGTASDWLMTLVEDEIDGVNNQSSIKKLRFSSRLKSNESSESTGDRELILRDMSKTLSGEANLLFRGNTLLTQALEVHMRRLSKEFLESTLMEKIVEIDELNPDCEVDPSKIHQSGGDLEAHWTQLINLTTEVWHCISVAAKKLNSELRHILKYIRAVAEDRYGDFLRSVAYTSVSGFLFLRFICPAILSPKLFGLLRDHPRPRAQRTFTLIAKALQKLANLSTFGKREEWMEPMNRFLNVQRPAFKEYIDQVCDIPAETGSRTLQASYSTPVTILGRLGPTAREGFPSLPFLIDQPRNLASLIKLWVDVKPADSKRVTLEGDILIFNDLCTALQKRADACLAKVESVRSAEAETTTPDELADIIEQASIIESLCTSQPGSTIWTEFERPPGSSGSEAATSTLPGDITPRKSRDVAKRSRDYLDVKKTSGLRHVSGGAAKLKNGKKGRTILNGIMRIGGGRAESPEGKTHK